MFIFSKSYCLPLRMPTIYLVNLFFYSCSVFGGFYCFWKLFIFISCSLILLLSSFKNFIMKELSVASLAKSLNLSGSLCSSLFCLEISSITVSKCFCLFPSKKFNSNVYTFGADSHSILISFVVSIPEQLSAMSKWIGLGGLFLEYSLARILSIFLLYRISMGSLLSYTRDRSANVTVCFELTISFMIFNFLCNCFVSTLIFGLIYLMLLKTPKAGFSSFSRNSSRFLSYESGQHDAFLMSNLSYSIVSKLAVSALTCSSIIS